MDFIKKVIVKQDSSIEELLECFEKIKKDGEVAVIKFDGERDNNSYTVFISFPTNKREMIRADENDLRNALIKVLTDYVKEN